MTERDRSSFGQRRDPAMLSFAVSPRFEADAELPQRAGSKAAAGKLLPDGRMASDAVRASDGPVTVYAHRRQEPAALQRAEGAAVVALS
jgi:hypothetical protein